LKVPFLDPPFLDFHSLLRISVLFSTVPLREGWLDFRGCDSCRRFFLSEVLFQAERTVPAGVLFENWTSLRSRYFPFSRPPQGNSSPSGHQGSPPPKEASFFQSGSVASFVTQEKSPVQPLHPFSKVNVRDPQTALLLSETFFFWMHQTIFCSSTGSTFLLVPRNSYVLFFFSLIGIFFPCEVAPLIFLDYLFQLFSNVKNPPLDEQ